MKLVFFHPKLNYPSLGGSDVHSHEILSCLKSLGFELYLFVLETEERPVIQKEGWGCTNLFVLRSSNPQVIKTEFQKYLDHINPEVIWVNYSSCDFILDHERYKNKVRVIYNHHFESVRKKMAVEYLDLWNSNVATSVEDLHPLLYDLDFFKNKEITPEEDEFKIYDQYDLVFAIEDYGASLIKKKCSNAEVFSFPVTLSKRACNPKYEKVALYTMSPYSFNFQGYYFFLKRILPLIRKKSPLFRTHLVGLGSEYFLDSPNVICKRFVPKLETEYEKARLTLCPSFSGTGQQIKIIESMHYAVPVVCMENPMQYNPIEHGQTGFIAKSAEEFAKYTLELYHNPLLAKTIGQQAQQSAQKNYQHEKLTKVLEQILIKVNSKV